MKRTDDDPTNIPPVATECEAKFTSSNRFSDEAAIAAFRRLAPNADLELRDTRANRTLIQYVSVVDLFEAFCAAHSLTPLPATGETLREWVRALFRANKTPATVGTYIGAIGAWHRLNNFKLDTSLASEWLRAGRRRAGPQRRAAALRAEELRTILAGLDPAVPADCRDATILQLAWGCALRSSEVTGLDWGREGPHAAGGTGHVTLEPAGVMVSLRKSKTAQASRVEVPAPDNDLPELRPWLLRWIKAADIRRGEPLFRPFLAGVLQAARLGPEAITAIIRRRVIRAAQARGLSDLEARIHASRYTSHSPRRGVITEAVAHNVPFALVRRRSRHRTDTAMTRYVAEAEQWTSSGLEGIWDGESRKP